MDRVMLTGRHMVRDVYCKNCDAKLGWMYEFATEDNQRFSTIFIHMSMTCPLYICMSYTIYVRYKEGKVILERALVQECDGIEEHPISD